MTGAMTAYYGSGGGYNAAKPSSPTWGFCAGTSSSAAGNPGTGSIAQTVTLAANTRYDLSFNSGSYNPTDPKQMCKLVVTIGDTTVFGGRVCGDPALPCTLGTYATHKFRADTVSYTSTVAGAAELKFAVNCLGGDGGYVVFVDNIVLTKSAAA
jgi:hypothetical protein